MKKKRITIILGILCIIGSFIWMLLSLSAKGGTLLTNGIIAKKKKRTIGK